MLGQLHALFFLNHALQCVKMLTIRQQLIAEDVKVEKTFYTACKRDMKEYGCVTGRDEDDSDTKRSAVLLCLENAMKRGTVDIHYLEVGYLEVKLESRFKLPLFLNLC